MRTIHSKPIPTEYEEQRAVCRYLDFLGLKYVHITNEGLRSQRTGYMLKQIGLQKGFPDLFILLPRGRYHGLAIEMKSLKGRPTADQLVWIKELNRLGYRAEICKGFGEAKDCIDRYIRSGTNDKG